MPRTRLLRHVVFLDIAAFVAFSPVALPTALASVDRFGQSDTAAANAPSRADTTDATASATPDPPPVAPLYLAGHPW